MHTTIVGGRVVLDPGRIAGVDEAAILREAQTAAEQLSVTAGTDARIPGSGYTSGPGRRPRMIIREWVNPPGLQPPVPHYSHVARIGNTLYLSGQLGFDTAGNIVGIGESGRAGTPGVAEHPGHLAPLRRRPGATWRGSTRTSLIQPIDSPSARCATRSSPRRPIHRARWSLSPHWPSRTSWSRSRPSPPRRLTWARRVLPDRAAACRADTSHFAR